jgi:hypothetical protein
LFSFHPIQEQRKEREQYGAAQVKATQNPEKSM